MFGNVIKYRVNRRGRPREFNIDKAIAELYSAEAKASSRLKHIRETSRGYRSESIIGSETSSPIWVQESFEALTQAMYGRDLSVKEIQEIESNIKELKRIGSARQTIARQATVDLIETEYIKALETFGELETATTRRYIQRIKSKLSKLDLTTKEEFFLGQYYQDPKSVIPEDSEGNRRIMKWATKNLHRPLSQREAWAYTLYRRLKDGLNI